MDEENVIPDQQQDSVSAKFTQTDVDRIVQDRLARERQKYEGHDEMKDVVAELNAFGYTGSPREVREAIKAQREAYQQQQELEQLQQQAEENGITPSLAKEIKDLKDELKQTKTELSGILGERKAKEQAIEQQRIVGENWNNQIAEFEEAYPTTNLDEVGKNQKFIDFIEGSGWTIKQAYAKFIKVYGELETEIKSKTIGKQMRSTSTGKGESTTADYSGLSSEQKETLSAWNKKYPHLAMTANEFKNR